MRFFLIKQRQQLYLSGTNVLDMLIMLSRVWPLPLNRNGTSQPCHSRKIRSRLARSGMEPSRCWRRRRGWRSSSRLPTHSTTFKSASLLFYTGGFLAYFSVHFQLKNHLYFPSLRFLSWSSVHNIFFEGSFHI